MSRSRSSKRIGSDSCIQQTVFYENRGTKLSSILKPIGSHGNRHRPSFDPNLEFKKNSAGSQTTPVYKVDGSTQSFRLHNSVSRQLSCQLSGQECCRMGKSCSCASQSRREPQLGILAFINGIFDGFGNVPDDASPWVPFMGASALVFVLLKVS